MKCSWQGKNVYKADFTIQDLPKRINQGHGSHWTVRHKEAKKWVILIGAHIRFNFPKVPLEKAKITIIRGSSVCPDYDGLVYSGKCLIDALRKLNVIKDDKMSNIGKPDYQWVKASPKKGFVRVIVEEQKSQDVHNGPDEAIAPRTAQVS